MEAGYMKRTFLLMALFVAIMLGSFIWYVATWDPSERPSLSHLPCFFGFTNIPGECEGLAPHSDGNPRITT